MKFKLINTFWVLLILVLANSCKKTENDPEEIYTVKGKFNNYSNPTSFDGLKVRLELFEGGLFGTKITKKAEGIISNEGMFELQYSGQVFSGDFYLTIERLIPDINIPRNVNFEKEYNMSTSGKLIINLIKDSILNPKDTLLIEFPGFEAKKIYSLPYGSFKDGILDTLSVPKDLSNSTIYSALWGRNYQQLLDAVYKKNNRYKEFKISGDPFIDTLTIKY